jgi:hypothetical protein
MIRASFSSGVRDAEFAEFASDQGHPRGPPKERLKEEKMA